MTALLSRQARQTDSRPGAATATAARRLLFFASLGVIVGSFLPWVDTGFGSYAGFAGAGVYTFYAGVLGFAGALVPFHRLAVAQGVLVATVAVALPAWQLLRLVTLVGVSGWTPGMGLVLVLCCGIAAARATAQLVRPAGETA